LQFDSALPGKRENCCGCQVVVCLCQSCGAHFAGPNVHRLRELATGWWLDGRMPGAASQPSGSKLPRHGMVVGRGIGLWLVLWNHCHSGPFQRLHSSWPQDGGGLKDWVVVGFMESLSQRAIPAPALLVARELAPARLRSSRKTGGYGVAGRMPGAALQPSGSELPRHMGSAG